MTADSGAKLTVTGKNKNAKNKAYVKVGKAGKTVKLVFSKKAVKGKYTFTVSCPANGKFKKTVKSITVKVK